MAAATDHAASFESAHVHAVYDEIAADFSRTRHSRWPFVERFFDSLPPGGLVLDAGTGNGKYLGCRSVLPDPVFSDPRGKQRAEIVIPTTETDAAPRLDLLPVGFDMSLGLLAIAGGRGHEVVRGDCVDMSCWRRGAFHHAISIATIHHFATPARRIEAIKQMILAVLPRRPPPPPSPAATRPAPARLLVVVWSLEQDPSLASRGGDRSARRTTGGKKGAVPVAQHPDTDAQLSGAAADARDVFVPWEKQNQVPRKREKGTPRRAARHPRRPAQEGVSPDVDARTEAGESADRDGPAGPPSAAEGDQQLDKKGPLVAASSDIVSAPPEPKPTFNRYYHLFRQYELSSLVASAAAQLGLAFDSPTADGDAAAALDVTTDQPNGEEEQMGASSRVAVVDMVEGWEAFVQLDEERWERENWVAEISVGWRRVDSSAPTPAEAK